MLLSAESTAFRLGHHPPLDGLRAVAVLLVLGFHLRLGNVPSLEGGFFGVDIFFVLSGFLITSILLREWDDTGAIHLGRFYIRRALRLLPALFTFVVALALFTHVIRPELASFLDLRMAGWALGYGLNWLIALGHVADLSRVVITHVWSLCVEEHFYLLWPFALRAMLGAGLGRGRIAILLALVAAGSALLRAGLWDSAAVWPSFLRCYFATDTRADGLMIGCLLAMLASMGALPENRIARGSLAMAGALVLAVMSVSASILSPFMYRGGLTIVAVATAAVMMALIRPSRPVAAWMGCAVMVWIGRLSYSLYLWHVVTFYFGGMWADRMGLALPIRLLLMVGGAFALASLSYYGVERPFLRWKESFARPRACVVQ